MKKLILIVFACFISISLFASTGPSCGGTGGTGSSTPGPTTPAPSCAASTPAGNTCATATPICDLNGYCGSTASTYTDDYWCELGQTFCGLSIENNSFLSFVASSTSMSFNIWVTGNSNGIQLMVFSSAGNCSGAVTSHACYNPGSIQSGARTITATGLTPGNTYYIMIDGNAGAVCNYTIGVTGSSGVALPPSVTPQSQTICLGQSVNLTASGGNGSYSWTAASGLSSTSGANVVATPPTTGVHTYTVNSTAGNPNCPTPANATATITVNNCGCPVTAANSGALCAGTGATFNLTATSSSAGVTGYSWTGPNGFTSPLQNPTGIVPPTAPGSYTYTVTATVNGSPCTATTTVVVNNCPSGCDVNLIRQTFLNAGCIELSSCVGSCSMYFLNPQSQTGSQAQAFAQSYGANLVSLQSAQENQCILDALTAINQTGVIWIGLSDEVTEGQFVWYDQSPVTYTNWAPGEPNQSGNEDCVQIYPNGANPGTWNDLSCSSSNAKSIIEVNLCPVLNAGPNVDICAGQSTIISPPPTILGSSPYTYSWNNGGPTTLSNTVTPTATTTYIVQTVDRFQCRTSDTIDVVVKPLPVVNAGNDVAVCAGSPVTLTGTGGTPSWNNGVVNGVAFTPTATTTYTYTGTTNGCSSTDNVTVTVNPLPVANAGADQAVCSGVPVTLNGTGGTPSWTGGVVNNTPFTPTATATYTLTVTDANSCTSTDNVLVTVNPTSVINAGVDRFVCNGETITLTATGGTSYTWVPAITQGVAFVPPLGTTTYTATDNNPTSCSGSDQVIVTVHPLPVVNAGADQQICEGTSVTLSGSGAVSYNWGSTVINGVPFTPPSTATYTVTGTDANGCQGTDQVTVNVTQTPEPSLTPSITSGCVPLTVTFTNNLTSNNTILWNLGNGQTSTNATSATTTYTVPGCYDISLTSTTPDGCMGDTALTSLICAFPNPVADFIPNPGVVSMNNSRSTMINESTGASTYIWNFGDGTTSSQTEPEHTFPFMDPGNYMITLIAISDHGCVDTARTNIEVQDALIYYVPNTFTPDDDEHNPVFKPVFTAGFDPLDYKMVIFNRWGEIIFESNDAAFGWDGTYTGSPGIVQDGTYTWKIEFKTTRTDERKMIIGHITLIR